MKCFLLLLVILASSAQAQVGGNTGGFNNCSVLYSSSHARLRIQLNGNKANLKSVFEKSPRMTSSPRFNGFSSWRYVAEDKSFTASEINGDIVLDVEDVDFINANQFGRRDCLFNGEAATTLLRALLESSSPEVMKTTVAGKDIESASILKGVLHCQSSFYGSSNESPSCWLKP